MPNGKYKEIFIEQAWKALKNNEFKDFFFKAANRLDYISFINELNFKHFQKGVESLFENDVKLDREKTRNLFIKYTKFTKYISSLNEQELKEEFYETAIKYIQKAGKGDFFDIFYKMYEQKNDEYFYKNLCKRIKMTSEQDCFQKQRKESGYEGGDEEQSEYEEENNLFENDRSEYGKEIDLRGNEQFDNYYEVSEQSNLKSYYDCKKPSFQKQTPPPPPPLPLFSVPAKPSLFLNEIKEFKGFTKSSSSGKEPVKIIGPQATRGLQPENNVKQYRATKSVASNSETLKNLEPKTQLETPRDLNSSSSNRISNSIMTNSTPSLATQNKPEVIKKSVSFEGGNAKERWRNIAKEITNKAQAKELPNIDKQVEERNEKRLEKEKSNTENTTNQWRINLKNRTSGLQKL